MEKVCMALSMKGYVRKDFIQSLYVTQQTSDRCYDFKIYIFSEKFGKKWRF
jgi:hypothetical protein